MEYWHFWITVFRLSLFLVAVVTFVTIFLSNWMFKVGYSRYTSSLLAVIHWEPLIKCLDLVLCNISYEFFLFFFGWSSIISTCIVPLFPGRSKEWAQKATWDLVFLSQTRWCLPTPTRGCIRQIASHHSSHGQFTKHFVAGSLLDFQTTVNWKSFFIYNKSTVLVKLE